MSGKMKKFDLKILDTTSERFKYIKPVTSMDTFQGMTQDFHEDGLFSTSIFGKVGTPDRSQRISYIRTKIKILHPKIYFLICAYKQFYKNIISGTAYATWNKTTRDFDPASNIDGRTGYNFFIEHFPEIRFVKNNSFSQNEAVEDINLYRGISLMDKVVVIPAGIRDIEISDDGEVTKHEINDYYVKLLSIANALPDSGDLNTSLTDRARLSMQLTACELYEYLSKLTGRLKKSFMRRKWGTRRIKYGSRNVISSLPTLPAYPGDPRSIRWNETAIGLYQALAVFAPLVTHHIINGYGRNYISEKDGHMNLVDMKTLKRSEVQVKPKVFDKWTTATGLGKLIDGFANAELRNRPIIIDGKYLGLVYRTDRAFRLINDIDDLADKENLAENVYPVTYGEFFYIHGFKWFHEYPGTVTRYPVNGYRSIYPCYPHVMTTTKDVALVELDENFQPTETMAWHYPNITEEAWFDGMALNLARLEGLGGD